MDKIAAPASAIESLTIVNDSGMALAVSALPGNRRPIVFSHGLGQNKGAWRQASLRLAAAGHPSLASDARGHGESQWNTPGETYHPDQFINDLIVTASQFDTAPVLVGASMGGLIGLIAESRWPGLFAAMVLADITPTWEADGVERILSFMGQYPDGFSTPAEAADAIAQFLPHRERKSDQALRAILRESADGRLHWHWDPRLLADMGRGAEQHQQLIADAARRIACPVLLISGGRSELVSERTINDFQNLVPHAHHIRLPEATHMIAGDDNDAFTTTVMQYLDTLPAHATDGLSATSHLTGATQ